MYLFAIGQYIPLLSLLYTTSGRKKIFFRTKEMKKEKGREKRARGKVEEGEERTRKRKGRKNVPHRHQT